MTIKLSGRSGNDTFSYAAYLKTYFNQVQSRGNATISQRRTLFREAKRRLDHGVPVGVLIQYVTIKLQTMGEVYSECD